MMTLHHSPASPYVRKAMILLHECDALDAVTLAPAAGTPIASGTMPIGANPLGKIPALERPDGCTLYDSRVITRYLASLSPEAAAFYPDSPALWEVLTLEATADGILDAAVLMRYETGLRPPGQRSEAWIEGQWSKIARALDAIESRWMAHLAGTVRMGHVAVGCALGYLDFRHADRDWRDGHPQLADWYAGFAARPSMRATIPPEA